jgi:hypothetical protein
VNNQQHAATWGVPKGHKGSKQQWIETLEARLQDAKRFRKHVAQEKRRHSENRRATFFRNFRTAS